MAIGIVRAAFAMRCPGRRLFSVLAGSLAAAVLISSAPIKAAERPAVGLDYGLYVGGLQALDFDTRLDLTADAYDVRVQVRTDGIIARLFPFVMEARSDGLRDEGDLRPKRYATANRWGDNGKRWVTLDYPEQAKAEAALPAVVAEPPPERDDRQVVPEQARRGTVDPVSAIYGLVLDSEGGCSGRREIFDGRRRYNLVAEDRGQGTVPSSSYGLYDGPARLCRLKLEQVEGFWTKYDAKRRYPDTIDVWLAKVAADLPPVPVRLEAETMVGALRVHLTGIRRGANASLPSSGLFPIREARRD